MVIVGYGDGRVTTRDITNNTANVVRFDVLDDDNIFVDIAD
jgi:ribose 5-phosphate isomerase A